MNFSLDWPVLLCQLACRPRSYPFSADLSASVGSQAPYSSAGALLRCTVSSRWKLVRCPESYGGPCKHELSHTAPQLSRPQCIGDIENNRPPDKYRQSELLWKATVRKQHPVNGAPRTALSLRPLYFCMRPGRLSRCELVQAAPCTRNGRWLDTLPGHAATVGLSASIRVEFNIQVAQCCGGAIRDLTTALLFWPVYRISASPSSVHSQWYCLTDRWSKSLKPHQRHFCWFSLVSSVSAHQLQAGKHRLPGVTWHYQFLVSRHPAVQVNKFICTILDTGTFQVRSLDYFLTANSGGS